VIVVGGSAGGSQALVRLVNGLPAELPAAVFVVQHTAPGAPDVLPAILGRAGSLAAKSAVDGEPVVRGQIYVAPPDRHMLLGRGVVSVTRGPREKRHRPAIDPLFRSAARNYGPRVVGVVLSGGLDDGTAGLVAIKARGGVAVVQHPMTHFMPRCHATRSPATIRITSSRSTNWPRSCARSCANPSASARRGVTRLAA
jgi:two-component system chemotaxis response regulator CheB